MFCRKCGNELPEEALFCNQCGARVRNEEVLHETVSDANSLNQKTSASETIQYTQNAAETTDQKNNRAVAMTFIILAASVLLILIVMLSIRVTESVFLKSSDEKEITAEADVLDNDTHENDIKESEEKNVEEVVDNIQEEHVHQWIDATCTTPKTCSICGVTEGEPTGHTPDSNFRCAQCGRYCFKDVQVGTHLNFGSYEQDNDTSNGAEPIEWEVLEKSDTSILLISSYVLDCVPFDNSHNSGTVYWEDSYLREWMNGDFYDKAFNNDEKSVIYTVSLTNENNPYYKDSNLKPYILDSTTDRVFCLSLSETVNYYNYNVWDDDTWFGYCEALVVPATDYAVSKGVKTYTFTSEDYYQLFSDKNYSRDFIGKTGAQWWLRTPGFNDVEDIVEFNGKVGGYTGWTHDTECGVRPAIRVVTE